MSIRQGSAAAAGRESGFAEDERPRATPLRPADDFDRDVWCVLGLPIDIADRPAAVAAIEEAVRDRRRLCIATPNVNWLVRALKDREARRQVIEAELSLADGAPIVMLARILGVPLKGRTAGSDVFEALRARGFTGRRLSVFFFGGREGAAEAAARALAAERRGLDAAGFLNPGHGGLDSMSSDAIIDAINAAAPDFIVVALGAAKGQAWIDRNKRRLQAPVISHLGAVVDFTAGLKARAPAWMQRAGLEWAWRIYAEPALWRRYFWDAVALAGIAATRITPQIAEGRAPRKARPLCADVVQEGAATIVRLSGDAVAASIVEARRAFRLVGARTGDVILDLSSVGCIDRAFLGLVLMLEKHVTRRGGDLRLRGASRQAQALFKANAMNYPAAAAATEIVRGGAAQAAAV
jgi:N-acetylglucosaminyldiphosphoundecaprenol N-acetyl-beta-D-mannosaminyltransferase